MNSHSPSVDVEPLHACVVLRNDGRLNDAAPAGGRVTLGWYDLDMSGMNSMKVGNKGRVVIPAELRERNGWGEGTVLVVFEHDDGVTELISREALHARLRAQIGDRDPTAELFAERRAEAAREDAEARALRRDRVA